MPQKGLGAYHQENTCGAINAVLNCFAERHCSESLREFRCNSRVRQPKKNKSSTKHKPAVVEEALEKQQQQKSNKRRRESGTSQTRRQHTHTPVSCVIPLACVTTIKSSKAAAYRSAYWEYRRGPLENFIADGEFRGGCASTFEVSVGASCCCRFTKPSEQRR